MANLVLYLWMSEARETRSWSAGGVSFLLYCNLCTREPNFNSIYCSQVYRYLHQNNLVWATTYVSGSRQANSLAKAKIVKTELEILEVTNINSL